MVNFMVGFDIVTGFSYEVTFRTLHQFFIAVDLLQVVVETTSGEIFTLTYTATKILLAQMNVVVHFKIFFQRKLLFTCFTFIIFDTGMSS